MTSTLISSGGYDTEYVQQHTHFASSEKHCVGCFVICYSPSKYTTMMGWTFDTSGLSSSGVRCLFQSASSLLQNLLAAAGTWHGSGLHAGLMGILQVSTQLMGPAQLSPCAADTVATGYKVTQCCQAGSGGRTGTAAVALGKVAAAAGDADLPTASTAPASLLFTAAHDLRAAM